MPRSNLQTLRQALHDLKAEGRQKLEARNALARKAEENDLTEAETAKLAQLDSELDELEAAVQKAEANVSAEEQRLDRERAFAPLPSEPAPRITSTEADPALTFGFDSLGEFAQAVLHATPGGGNVPRYDERLRGGMGAAPTNFHQEQGTTEGYMVPPTYRDDIWEMVFAEGDLLSAIDSEPTNGNAVHLSADESTPWGATGVQAFWRSEAGKMDPSKLDTEGRLVKLHELYAFVTASDELLEDAPRLNARLSRRAPEAIRWKASDAIIYGTGAGQPLGYMNSDALVTVDKEGSQPADTILVSNIGKMYSRLLMMPGGSPRWLANSDIITQLLELTVGDKPVWTPPVSGMREAPGGFLLGLPIRWSEHAKTLGDRGDLQLIDPMGYYGSQKRGGIKFDSSIHLYFDFGLQAFRWTFRMGGQPFLSKPVTPPNSPNTKSHFVVLAERA